MLSQTTHTINGQRLASSKETSSLCLGGNRAELHECVCTNYIHKQDSVGPPVLGPMGEPVQELNLSLSVSMPWSPMQAMAVEGGLSETNSESS